MSHAKITIITTICVVLFITLGILAAYVCWTNSMTIAGATTLKVAEQEDLRFSVSPAGADVLTHFQTNAGEIDLARSPFHSCSPTYHCSPWIPVELFPRVLLPSRSADKNGYICSYIAAGREGLAPEPTEDRPGSNWASVCVSQDEGDGWYRRFLI